MMSATGMMRFAELQGDLVGEPLPHSLLARHHRAVIAIAEVLADSL